MKILDKGKEFLKLGACGGVCALTVALGLNMIGDIAPQGQKVEDSHGFRGTFEQNVKNGVDTISHGLLNVALTQPTEIYRYNVMENLMKGRSDWSFFMFSKNLEEEIRNENLKKAEKLGVFKDVDAFRAEIDLLKVASSTEKANNRIFKEDKGIVDITDPSHFEGVKNIEQVKQKIADTLSNVREEHATSNAKKPKA